MEERVSLRWTVWVRVTPAAGRTVGGAGGGGGRRGGGAGRGGGGRGGLCRRPRRGWVERRPRVCGIRASQAVGRIGPERVRRRRSWERPVLRRRRLPWIGWICSPR